MAEEFLNVSKIGALVQEVGGESVAQAVRADVVDVGALADVFVDHAADAAGRDAAPAAMEEYRLMITLGFGTFV